MRQDSLLLQRRRGTRLDTGAARDALRVEEALTLARRDTRVEATPLDRQRECPLHFIARAHTARANDAGIGIEAEIGIAVVDGRIDVARPIGAITILRTADSLRHLPNLGAHRPLVADELGRMIGQIELHDAAAQTLQLLALRLDLHPLGDFGGAGCRATFAAFDFNQAEPARAERLERIGCAEL